MRRGHANVLCIAPILVYVLLKRVPELWWGHLKWACGRWARQQKFSVVHVQYEDLTRLVAITCIRGLFCSGQMKIGPNVVISKILRPSRAHLLTRRIHQSLRVIISNIGSFVLGRLYLTALILKALEQSTLHWSLPQWDWAIFPSQVFLFLDHVFIIPSSWKAFSKQNTQKGNPKQAILYVSMHENSLFVFVPRGCLWYKRRKVSNNKEKLILVIIIQAHRFLTF